ncbi:hypothetical protein GCM10027217_29580 [Pseudomaricurvus hydrocarbonicus]
MLIVGCASEIEKINTDINRYPYCQDRTPAMNDIRQTGCGDCEDYAFAKCLALRQQGYDVIFLYRSGTDVGHVALAVNGQTLDNQVAWPYPFKPDDWTYSHPWDCQELPDQQETDQAAQASQPPESASSTD